MTGIGLIADGVLIALLLAALVSIYRLNRRLNELRAGRAEFEKLAAELGKQTSAAGEGLAALRGTAEIVGRDLAGRADGGRQVMAELQKVSDDLRLLIGRADSAAGRLEAVIAKARSHEAAAEAAERKLDAEAGRQAERVSPEKAALLSQLSGIR